MERPFGDRLRRFRQSAERSRQPHRDGGRARERHQHRRDHRHGHRGQGASAKPLDRGARLAEGLRCLRLAPIERALGESDEVVHRGDDPRDDRLAGGLHQLFGSLHIPPRPEAAGPDHDGAEVVEGLGGLLERVPLRVGRHERLHAVELRRDARRAGARYRGVLAVTEDQVPHFEMARLDDRLTDQHLQPEGLGGLDRDGPLGGGQVSQFDQAPDRHPCQDNDDQGTGQEDFDGEPHLL